MAQTLQSRDLIQPETLPNMKLQLLFALGAVLILANCSSTSTASVENPPGQPLAITRAERKAYATPTPVSNDPSSPLSNVVSNGTSASVAIATF